MTAELGQMVGNYRLLRQLGAGGMGSVFEAKNEEIGRSAAIKMLRPELCADPLIAARFLNEARAANLIRHPGFVEIYEFGRMPSGLLYIVMELLDGESLSRRLRRFPDGTPVGWTLEVARQLASALAVAHDRAIVHRDLKPANLMLVPHLERPDRERIKILDLGIAKVGGQEVADAQEEELHTKTGIAMGTPQYMAPEQCLGAARVDGQSDVYSLGIILYEAFSGRRPFEGDSALEVMNQQVQSSPTPLLLLRPELPPAVGALIEQLLAKQPGERPTMRDLASAVSRLSAQLSGPTAASAASGGNLSINSTSPGERRSAISSGEAGLAGDIDSDGPTMPRRQPGAGAPRPVPTLPFIAGPPISEPRHFIGRQRELRRLSNLWRQFPVQNAALVGPRRAGKSSILLTLKSAVAGSPLRPGQQLDFLPPTGTCQFIYIDFQDPRLGTVDGLLRQLLGELRMRVPEVCDLDQFMNIVAGRLRTPTIILLDEIGVALERYRSLDAVFWEGMRALATNQTDGRLGFLLACHRPPHELAEQSLGGSPFFNIFAYCATIGPLSDPEARSLIALSPVPFTERDSAWILEQSQRWPVLLQVLCRERLLALQDGEAGDGWRDEALRQSLPFAYLLKGA